MWNCYFVKLSHYNLIVRPVLFSINKYFIWTKEIKEKFLFTHKHTVTVWTENRFRPLNCRLPARGLRFNSSSHGLSVGSSLSLSSFSLTVKWIQVPNILTLLESSTSFVSQLQWKKNKWKPQTRMWRVENFLEWRLWKQCQKDNLQPIDSRSSCYL